MPLNTMLSRSPSGTSSAIAAVSFVTGRLSPVSAASAVCSAADSISRPSAGMVSPSSMRMMSPGTISAAGTLRRSPPRITDGIGRRHRPKRRHGRFCARFLHEAHRRVQQHDGEDGDGLVRQGGVALDGPEAAEMPVAIEQQDDEHILELRQEPPPGRARVSRRPVRSLRTARGGRSPLRRSARAARRSGARRARRSPATDRRYSARALPWRPWSPGLLSCGGYGHSARRQNPARNEIQSLPSERWELVVGDRQCDGEQRLVDDGAGTGDAVAAIASRLRAHRAGRRASDAHLVGPASTRCCTTTPTGWSSAPNTRGRWAAVAARCLPKRGISSGRGSMRSSPRAGPSAR